MDERLEPQQTLELWEVIMLGWDYSYPSSVGKFKCSSKIICLLIYLLGWVFEIAWIVLRVVLLGLCSCRIAIGGTILRNVGGLHGLNKTVWSTRPASLVVLSGLVVGVVVVMFCCGYPTGCCCWCCWSCWWSWWCCWCCFTPSRGFFGLPGTHHRKFMRQCLDWLDPGMFGTGRGLKARENLLCSFRNFFVRKMGMTFFGHWVLNMHHNDKCLANIHLLRRWLGHRRLIR